MRRLLAACSLLAMTLVGCGAPAKPTEGTPATRVVSLVPAATETLFAIGAGSRVIAVSSFDHYPPAVEKLPRVGALLDPDLERIIALRPDLAIVFEGQQELREKLSRAGIGVFPYPRPTVADILRATRAIGARVGFREQADREAADIERKLDDVRRNAAGKRAVRTMLVLGREPGALRNIFVSGGFGFLEELLKIAGGSNVFGAVKRENLQVTTESILSAQPDAIIEVVASRTWTEAEIQEEIRVWDSLGAVPAVRNRRVYLLVGDEFVIPGPRVVTAARRFADVLGGAEARSPGIRNAP